MQKNLFVLDGLIGAADRADIHLPVRIELVEELPVLGVKGFHNSVELVHFIPLSLSKINRMVIADMPYSMSWMTNTGG